MIYVIVMSREYYLEEYQHYTRELARVNRELTSYPTNPDLLHDKDYYERRRNEMYAKWQNAPVRGKANLWRAIDRVAHLVDKISTHKI